MAGGIDNISSPGDVDISSLFVSTVCNCVHFNSSFTSFNESLSVTILWNKYRILGVKFYLPGKASRMLVESQGLPISLLFQYLKIVKFS